MTRHLDDNEAIQLLAAIVQRAEIDYKVSVRRIAKLKDKTDKASADKLRLAKRMKADCERFFRSDHFTALTGADGRLMLDRLPRRERKVLYLYYVLGYTARRIADEEEMDERTVYKQKASGLERLEEVWEMAGADKN